MNRKIYLIGMMILAMLFASCKKEEKTEVQEEFSIMAVTEDDGSKTYLDGNRVKWIANTDVIKVFDRSSNAVNFTCKTVESTGTEANFTSTTPVDDQGEYWAFYPATQDVNPTRSGNTFTFTMPATQTYKEGNTFNNNIFPMAAHYPSGSKSGVKLQFKNAFGILKISATGNCKIYSIVLTDNNTDPNANKWLSGNFTFNPDNINNNPTAAAGNNSNVLTLKITDGKQLDPNNPTYFYMILPPGCLAGAFNLKFYDVESPTSNTTPVKDINKNQNEAIPGFAVERSILKTATTSIQKTFSFTVGQDNQGKPIKVQFAPGNLQYQASSGTWRFAEHTWDFIDGVEVNWQDKGWTILYGFYEKTANNNPASSFRQDVLYYPNGGQVSFNGYWRDNQPDWIDLFGWGTSNAVDAATQGGQFDEPWHWVGGGIGGQNFHSKYGPASGNLAGTNWDWSVNAISNSTETGWRTLTNSEWSFLVNAPTKYGFAELLFKPYSNVNGNSSYLSGIVLLPDGFVDPCSQGASENQPFKDAAHSSSSGDVFDNNRFTEAGWSKMEAAGAVFLPCAGVRGNFSVINASSKYHGGKKGLYWSSTGHNSDKAYSFVFQNSLTAGSSSDDRSAGGSVRLVREVP